MFFNVLPSNIANLSIVKRTTEQSICINRGYGHDSAPRGRPCIYDRDEVSVSAIFGCIGLSKNDRYFADILNNYTYDKSIFNS